MIIQLPCAGWDVEQAEYVAKLLREEVPAPHQKGVQLLFRPNMLEAGAVYREVLKRFDEGEVVTIHAPISPHKYHPLLNLVSHESVDFYKRMFDYFAQFKSDALVVVHGNVVYTHDEWQGSLRDYNFVREHIFGQLRNNLTTVLANAVNPVSIENMCFPLLGHTTYKPKEVPFDPTLITLEQVMDFLEQVPGVHFTFDTSHAGLSWSKVNYLVEKYGNDLTAADIDREELTGLYPEMVCKQPDILDAFRKIDRVGAGSRIRFVQLSDYSGAWFAGSDKKPGKIFSEGHEVGKGDFGDTLYDLVRMIDREYSHVAVSVDVEAEDGKDRGLDPFLVRTEQIRSVRRIVEALGR